MKIVMILISFLCFNHSFAQEVKEEASKASKSAEGSELPSVEELMTKKIDAYQQGQKIEKIDNVVNSSGGKEEVKMVEPTSKAELNHPTYRPLTEEGAKAIEAVPVYKIEKVAPAQN